MSDAICVICKRTLSGTVMKIRYENKTYSFDSERCKRIFYENPDRWLDAGGGVLEQPR